MAKMMLYNGALLPDINGVYTPELKETHPYAVITARILASSTTYYLRCCENVVTGRPSTGLETSGDIIGYVLTDGVWVKQETATLAWALKWTNHDIYDGGTIYLAASAPVDPNAPTFTPADFTKWLMAGQAVHRGVRKEATMYSYNGVVLPKLPEWNKKKYPYAFIVSSSGVDFDTGEPFTYYTLYVTDIPPVIAAFETTVFLHHPDGSSATFYCGSVEIYNGDTNWGGAFEYKFFNQIAAETIIWTNFDLLVSEGDPLHDPGSVYLKASEPIPIYE